MENNLQVKDLPGALSSKAQALIEALEGKVDFFFVMKYNLAYVF